MQIIENSSERQYDVSAKVGEKIVMVQVPPARKDDDGKAIKGTAKAEDAFVTAAKLDPWFVAICDSGDLTVKAAKADAPAKDDAKK
jgi:hypothetical protein